MLFSTDRLKKYIAEVVASFAYVFFGSGAMILYMQPGNLITYSSVAFCFGLITMVLIFSVGEVSGAHINPCVTIGFAAAGRSMPVMILPYIISQFAGAACAASTLSLLFPNHPGLGILSTGISHAQLFIVQLIPAFFLMLTILQVASGGSLIGMRAGIAVGSMVFLGSVISGLLTGSGLNPAHSFALAIISGNYENLFLYFFAPLAGNLAAVPVHLLFRK